MTTWTTISNAAVAVGAIPSSTTVTALRDNPIAIAEASSASPVNVYGWHPYDKVTVGDGKQGVIYDYSISGAVSSIVSPDFVDGYEYRFFGFIEEGISIDLYREVSASYSATNALPSIFDGDGWFDFVIEAPRIARQFHTLTGTITRTGNLAPVALLVKAPTSGAPALSKITKIRFNSTSPTAAGKVWMMRRRDFASAD